MIVVVAVRIFLLSFCFQSQPISLSFLLLFHSRLITYTHDEGISNQNPA